MIRKTFYTLLILFLGQLAAHAGLRFTYPSQSILFFKDKDGIYLFDANTKLIKLVFKANDEQIFLDEPFQLKDNVLTIGIKGEYNYLSEPYKISKETNEKYYYSINLETTEYWLAEKIGYKIDDGRTLFIDTTTFDKQGSITHTGQTSTTFKSSNGSYNGVNYNNFPTKFLKETRKDTKHVYSQFGSIFYVENGDTSLLVEHTGNYYSKLAIGNFYPQLDSAGEYVYYQYYPNYVKLEMLNSSPALRKINLETKKITTLKLDTFSDFKISKDGNFILYTYDTREGKLDTWISDIYLMDLTTLREKRISSAYSAFWIDF